MNERHDEDATIRAWTDLLGRIRFGTVRISKRKTIAGATIKAVAERLTKYADSDGSRIHPGIARLAVDMELSQDTVKLAMSVLVQRGLLRLVQPGTIRGQANRYQLAIPADLLDQTGIEVWSPPRYELEVAREQDKTRGTRRPAGNDVQGAQPPARQADTATGAGCSTPRTPVDNSAGDGAVQGAQHPAPPPPSPERAGCSGRTNPPVQGVGGTPCRVLSTLPPPIDRATTTTDHPGHDRRTELAVPRARPPSKDQQLPARGTAAPAAPPDDRCPLHPRHPAGRRPDGRLRCPPCAAAAHVGQATPPPPDDLPRTVGRARVAGTTQLPPGVVELAARRRARTA